MSKAAKKSIFILIFLLVCSLGFAFYTVIEKQKLEQVKNNLKSELVQTQGKVKKYARESKALKGQVQQLDSERLKLSGEKTKLNNEVFQLKGKVRKAERQADDFLDKMSEIKRDRNKWKRRVDNVSRERDQLVQRVKEFSKEKSEFEKQLSKAKVEAKEALTKVSSQPKIVWEKSKPVKKAPSFSAQELKSSGNEGYWASVLEQKASLEVEIARLEEDLSEKSMKIVDLKQDNDNLKVELDDLKYNKEEIGREIEHKSNMINNLALELARTKNDKKFISNRVKKVNEENFELRKKVKSLVSTKGALEKSIVRLTRDKGKIEKELGKTEIIIQSKIDEIWDIKDSLDRTIRKSSKAIPDSNEVELPPIVVSSGGSGMSFNPGKASNKFNGRIVSLNEENNFAIVDIGENTGIHIGDTLSVYRDSKYIARLEVIQVRKDIAAADLKNQWSKIRIGDIVK